MNEPNVTKKGKKFEEFFENLMAREKDFEFISKHSRSEIGEVDYFYCCKAGDHVLWRISPVICIECKNWNEKISSEKMNHFIALVKEKSPFSCCGVYVTTSSYSKQARTAMRDARIREKIVIIPVESKHLDDLINIGFKEYVPKLGMKTVLQK